MGSSFPPSDRPLVIWELLGRIATLKTAGADPAEIDRVAAEFRRLRAEL